MTTEAVKSKTCELEEKRELIMSLYCKGLSDPEAEHFFTICKKMDLNPLAKQIYVYKMGGKMTIIVSIDGLRLTADRTGSYAPGKETVFMYKKDGSLLAATAYVKKLTKDGQWHEVSAIAFFDEYCAQNLWKKMPHVMLSKCAEAQALRKAFPAELSGVYVKEEMDQAKDDSSITIEPLPQLDATIEEACKAISECTKLENDSMLRTYIETLIKNAKCTHSILMKSCSENVDRFIDRYGVWKLKSN